MPGKIRFKKANSKGVVLLTTLVVLSLVIFACVSMTAMLLNDTYTVRKIIFSTQANYLAETGLEEALKELHDDFNYIPDGFPKELGKGEYDITITTHPDDPNMKLIISTGQVKEVSKTIKVQVVYEGLEAFDFLALGGGSLKIAGGSTIGTSGNPSKVHSNSTDIREWVWIWEPIWGYWKDPAVQIGTDFSEATVFGDASGCGQVYVHPDNGTVTGDVTSSASYVELPSFDDNFFQYYYDLASEDGAVYTPGWPYIKVFTSDPCAGTENHVVYVQGEVRLVGTWEMTGCIVATDKVVVNKWAHGEITQHQWENLPAFMSKNSDIEIWDPTNIEGMLYAGDEIFIESLFGEYGPTNITGSVYGRGQVRLSAQTDINYVRPNPPGLPEEEGSLKIVYWGGG